jgi:uncharacterized Fe-S center protein
MSKADVFFSNLRAGPRQNLLQKLEGLLNLAKLSERIRPGDLVAVKLHFGELGNTAFIRPVFVRRVVEVLKKLGARPFLTDANTLYVGSRSNAVNHLETALANGFSYTTVGAPLIIADGLRGNSHVDRTLRGDHFKTVHIATEFANADAVVSLAHFKAHELSGFGGTLKNLGMGCASRQGKLAQHSNVSPKIKKKKCVACGLCVRWCAHGALRVEGKAQIDPSRCVGCGECIITCPEGAIQIQWNEGPKIMQEKMAEYAVGALQGKEDKSVFVNFITQVSPACDCYGHADAPIVADVGITSSTDPVAIDQASVDLVNRMEGRADSALTINRAPGEDKFRGIYPQIDWAVQLEHAQKLGLGTRQYQLHDIESPT